MRTQTLAFAIMGLGLFSANSFSASNSTTTDQQLATCKAIAEAANYRKLDELVISLRSAAKVDINNDGKLEQVELNSDGTMHWERLSVSDQQGKPIEIAKSEEDDWEEDRLRWAMDQLLIKYKGQIYILGKTDDYLHYLSQVDRDYVEKVVCEFAQRSEPVEILVTSSNNKLCQLALKQELSYVEFDRTHALTHTAVNEAGYYETSPGDQATQVDIDNDGVTELVVKLGLASGRGRGCDGERLGVLNKVRNKLDKEISSQLPGPECGGITQTPFLFEGQTYIEVMYPSEHPINTHRVVRLKDGRLNTICQYDVRVVNYVLGEYERILDNAKTKFVDPWDYALSMPETSGLQIMIEAKHDPRYTTNNYGTVINTVIFQRQYDKLELLLKHGIDPEVTAKDPTSIHPLGFAVQQGEADAVRLLVKYGADPNRLLSGQPLKWWVLNSSHNFIQQASMLEALSIK